MSTVKGEQPLNWYVAQELEKVKIEEGLGALFEGVRSAKVNHLKATKKGKTEDKYKQTAKKIKEGSLIKMAAEGILLLRDQNPERANEILQAIKNTYDVGDLPHSTRVALKVAQRQLAGEKVSILGIHVREGIQAIKESFSDLWKVVTGKALETLPEYRKIMKLAEQNKFGPEFIETLKNFISKAQNTVGLEPPIVTALKDFEKVVRLKDPATMGRFASLIRSKMDAALKANKEVEEVEAAYRAEDELVLKLDSEHTKKLGEASEALSKYRQASLQLTEAGTLLPKIPNARVEILARERGLLMAEALVTAKRELSAAEAYKQEADARVELARSVVQKAKMAAELAHIHAEWPEESAKKVSAAVKNEQDAEKKAQQAAKCLNEAQEQLVPLKADFAKELIKKYSKENKISEPVARALFSLIDTAVKSGKDSAPIDSVAKAVKTLIEKGMDKGDFASLIQSDLDFESKLEVLQLVNDAPNEYMEYFKQVARGTTNMDRKATLADIVYKVANTMAVGAREAVQEQESIVAAAKENVIAANENVTAVNEAVAKQKEEVSRVRAIAEREKQSEHLATSFEESFDKLVPEAVVSARGRSKEPEETFLSAQEKLIWLEKHAERASGELERNRLALKRAEEKLRKAKTAVQEFREKSYLSVLAKLREPDAKQAFGEIIDADIPPQDKVEIANQVMRRKFPDYYLYTVSDLLQDAKFAQRQAEKARTEFKEANEKAEAQLAAAVGKFGYKTKKALFDKAYKAGVLDVERKEKEAKKALEKLELAIQKSHISSP